MARDGSPDPSASMRRVSRTGVADLSPRQTVTVQVTRQDGSQFSFDTLCRIDTANEVEYFMNGGILHYVLRKLAA